MRKKRFASYEKNARNFAKKPKKRKTKRKIDVKTLTFSIIYSKIEHRSCRARMQKRKMRKTAMSAQNYIFH